MKCSAEKQASRSKSLDTNKAGFIEDYVICHDSCGIGGTESQKFLKPQGDFEIIYNNLVFHFLITFR